MKAILTRVEELCEQIEGVAGLAITISAAYDSIGIDRRALNGLSRSIEDFSKELADLYDEIRIFHQYNDDSFL